MLKGRSSGIESTFDQINRQSHTIANNHQQPTNQQKKGKTTTGKYRIKKCLTWLGIQITNHVFLDDKNALCPLPVPKRGENKKRKKKKKKKICLLFFTCPLLVPVSIQSQKNASKRTWVVCVGKEKKRKGTGMTGARGTGAFFRRNAKWAETKGEGERKKEINIQYHEWYIVAPRV